MNKPLRTIDDVKDVLNSYIEVSAPDQIIVSQHMYDLMSVADPVTREVSHPLLYRGVLLTVIR